VTTPHRKPTTVRATRPSIAVPRQMIGTLQRDERGIGDPARQLLAKRQRNRSIRTPMNDESRRANVTKLVLQLPDAYGLTGDLAVGVGQVGLQRGTADRRSAAVGRGGVRLCGVDLAEQVGVAVEEREVDARRGRSPRR
jgi:hypothetical protein